MTTGNHYHIAQANIGRMFAPPDDPIMFGFTSQLNRINALAEAAPGFVWRLADSTGDATSIRIYDDPLIIINMSVWESVDLLFNFTYKQQHTEMIRGRREWFESLDVPHMALWWIPAGTVPVAQDVKERLDHLRDHGPTPYAFTFKVRFPMPEAQPERQGLTD